MYRLTSRGPFCVKPGERCSRAEYKWRAGRTELKDGTELRRARWNPLRGGTRVRDSPSKVTFFNGANGFYRLPGTEIQRLLISTRTPVFLRSGPEETLVSTVHSILQSRIDKRFRFLRDSRRNHFIRFLKIRVEVIS